MDRQTLNLLLEEVRAGRVSVAEASDRLHAAAMATHAADPPGLPLGTSGHDLGFAHVDGDRGTRCGFPEVVYCPGKRPEEAADIAATILAQSDRLLMTRADPGVYAAVQKRAPDARFEERARCIVVQRHQRAPVGRVAVIAAGTADLPVAEEARITAEVMEARVEAHYDVGVAGIHRLLARLPAIRRAHALVVVAGMEGALASVVGGLVEAPVIGVPTSVGYGAAFSGLAPLLTMLNACAAGVAVVNIDNGFGAGYLAALINRRSTAPG